MAAAKCTQIVKSQIPTLDEDLSQYIHSKFKCQTLRAFKIPTHAVSGVLETSCDDFESGEDVFEAIGSVLNEIAADKSELEIR